LLTHGSILSRIRASTKSRGGSQAFFNRAPNTFKAFQHMQMAFDDGAKYIGKGKKTIFGRDKGRIAFEKIRTNLGRSIVAMRTDGIIGASATTIEVRENMLRELQTFCQMTPDWERASMFIALFFGDDDSPIMEMLEHQLEVNPA